MDHTFRLPFPASGQLRSVAMTLCGLVLAITAPALWFAWTIELFAGFMVAGIAAGAIYCWLSGFEENIDLKRAKYTLDDHPEIDDEALEAILSLAPFTCHNSSHPSSAYNRKIKRVKAVLSKKGLA